MSGPLKGSPKNTTNSSTPLAPSEFTLYQHRVRVKRNPALTDVDKYGVAEYPINEIRLYTVGLPNSVEHHTFCHELVHFLLHYAGRDDLADDEVLVDTLGGLLAQYEATKRY